MAADMYTEAHRDARPAGPLAAGTPAPDFTLPRAPNDPLRLADLRGHPVILAFYPADWTPARWCAGCLPAPWSAPCSCAAGNRSASRRAGQARGT